MNEQRRRLVQLIFGLLFVTSPLYAPQLGVTTRDYQYESVEIVVEDNRIHPTGEARDLHGIDGLDCYREYRPYRDCTFEAAAIDGNVSGTHPSVKYGGVGSRPDRGYFVAFTGDGRVFARTSYWDEQYVLGLERANATEALNEISSNPEFTSEKTMTAIERGSVRSNQPLPDANELVKTSDSYFVVYETRRPEPPIPMDSGTTSLLQWLAVLFGAFLVRDA